MRLLMLCLLAFVSLPAAAHAAPLSTADAPNFWSLLPPILAIGAALAFRQVLPALFAGVWLGAWFIGGASLPGIWDSFLDSFSTYAVGAAADPDHAAIIAFTLMIGGMVGIISKNGGVAGVVTVMTRWANTARRAQLGVGALGVAIFFDDYANTLIVGNTMRPITDAHNISREKLAYLVDSTAAPITCFALVTTWIGYQVGLIGSSTEGVPGLAEPYVIFLNTIPYNFYPILALVFVFMVAGWRRDFGPMLKAERAARAGHSSRAALKTVDHTPDKDIPHRAANAFLPIIAMVAGVCGGLYVTGEGDTLTAIIGSADSYKALLWGSLIGAGLAGALSLAQRLLTLEELIEAWSEGVKAMLAPILILVLAWSLASVTDALGAASYLTGVVSGNIPLPLLPALVFIIAAATAFATGTSWGVMGILMPLVIPLMLGLISVNGAPDPAQFPLLYSAIACVLAGAVWGDHCSPISDTTVMSSLASGCDHVEHVRTQMPYALLVGGVSILAGILPTSFGAPWWAGMALGAGVLALTLRLVGRHAETEADQSGMIAEPPGAA